MQAYSMAAQAGAPFPLSVLFKMLHVDGKERILPEIVQFETLQQQMQEMASMNEQLTMRNQELEAGIANLQEINAAIAEQGAMTSFTGGAGPSGVNAPEGGGFM
jgi:hypothetical protein